MSLNFRYDGVEDTKKWDRKDWAAYNALIWATMGADIGELKEENIHEFCRRVNALRLIDATDDAGKPQDLTASDIRKFIGLKTNVITLTADQWARKHFGKDASERYAREMKYKEKHATETQEEPNGSAGN